MVKVEITVLKILLFAAVLVGQGCATTEELFAQYDENFCAADVHIVSAVRRSVNVDAASTEPVIGQALVAKPRAYCAQTGWAGRLKVPKEDWPQLDWSAVQACEVSWCAEPAN